MSRKVRMAMVGGGEGAFIGAIHRHASQLDSVYELVAGAFSSDAARSKSFGQSLGLSESRCYTDYQELLAQENQLPENERVELVSVVTPNHLHFPVSKAAIEAGFHVICDKPVTLDLDEAVELAKVVDKHDRLFALTHTYTGYPMVREARQRVATAQLGKVRKVIVEYTQGWLANQADESSKQAEWRLDPKRSGISGCMGDIGVHAANLAEFVTGDTISQLCAQLNTVVPGRQLDDDGAAFLKFSGGATGSLIASQVMTGEENNLTLRVYGDKAGLEWRQTDSNSLWLKYPDQSTQCVRAGVGPLSEQAVNALRTPAGHPEGYLEAFANIYTDMARSIVSHESEQSSLVPTMQDGLRGMAFIEAMVASNQSGQQWQNVKDASALI